MCKERSELTPLDRVADAFGDMAKLADALDLTKGAVHHWKTRNSGRIPSAYQKKILQIAAARSLDLSAVDLIE